jgi:Asp-tRNA(Asn)/Glu-tRNA(Gln) amidotransferase A subunit family amidase
MGKSLVSLQATQVVAGLSSGELALNDVVGALRTQQDAVNGNINAFEFTSDKDCQANAERLHGLPITVKDQITVAGMPLSHGLDRANRKIPTATAPVVQRFLDAGANVLGKTTLPPYAMDFQTFNSRNGVTRNPWNSDCTAGGSSGGGAAAVATGMSYLDIGADLSGSLRLPAAYCGVYSLMPTDEPTQSQGLLPNGAELEHFARPGPIARSPEDLSLAWSVMTGQAIPNETGTRFKIATWNAGTNAMPVSDETAAVFKSAIKKLATDELSSSSADLSALFNPQVSACFGEIMGYETGGLMPAPIRVLARLTGKSAAQRSPNFLKHIHAGYRRDKKMYREALSRRQTLQASFESSWADHDAILIPVCGVQPFAHQTPSQDRGGVRDYKTTFDLGGTSVGYFDALTAFTVPVSLMGNPVVTIPLGLDRNGMPVGGQLIGRHGGEIALLQLARKIASVLPRLTNAYLAAIL